MTKKQMIYEIIAHTDKQGLNQAFIDKRIKEVDKEWITICYRSASSNNLFNPKVKNWDDPESAFRSLANALYLWEYSKDEVFTN